MAIFNNGYPATYQNPYMMQQYQYPVQQPPQQQTQQNSGVIWVQGEAGAKSYLVAPNNTVQLWDSEAQVIYLKSADASGMPSIKTLDYTIRESGTAPKEPAYATKKEIDELREQLDSLHDEVQILSIRKKPKREVEDDE